MAKQPGSAPGLWSHTPPLSWNSVLRTVTGADLHPVRKTLRLILAVVTALFFLVADADAVRFKPPFAWATYVARIWLPLAAAYLVCIWVLPPFPWMDTGLFRALGRFLGSVIFVAFGLWITLWAFPFVFS
jgi:hypothetical protein